MLQGLKRQFVLANVSGIPVRADVRWVFVIGLMAAIVGASLMPLTRNFVSAALFGLSTTLIFLVSIFLHEFAHALIARIEGLRVLEIVLHPFGGFTRFRTEPKTPRAEFRIAIAGPAASFILAVGFALIATAATSLQADILVVLAATLAIGNFLVAVFNLFPGYPLDGGRVLRADLWRSGRNLDEATILTGHCGQVIAVAMIVFGLVIALFRQQFFIGFWAVLVGIFLWDAAKGIIREVNRQEHISVETMMMLPMAAKPESTVQEFIDGLLPVHRRAAIPVAIDRHVLGMLLLTDMRSVDRSKWRATLIGEVMRPVSEDQFVEVGTPLSAAKEIMRTNGMGSVCVIDASGDLVGIVHGTPLV